MPWSSRSAMPRMHDASAGTMSGFVCGVVPAFQCDGQHVLFGNCRAHTEIEHAFRSEPLPQAGGDLPGDCRIVTQGLGSVAFEGTQHAEDQRAARLQSKAAGLRNGPVDQVGPADHEAGPRAAHAGLVAARDAVIDPQLQRLFLPQEHRTDARSVGVVDEDRRSGRFRHGDDGPGPFRGKGVKFAGHPGQDSQ